MTDQPSGQGGWLPPRAPGSHEAPQFSGTPQTPRAPHGWAPPQAAPGPDRVAPAPPRAPADTDRPVFSQPEKASSNGLATASLVLAIAGLVVLLFTLGLGFFISLACSGAAWGMAIAARRRLRAGRASGGEGQAKAGLYLGIAGVVLGIVAMIVWIVLLASGFDLEQWQRDLERELERQRRGEGQLSLLRAALSSLVRGG